MWIEDERKVAPLSLPAPIAILIVDRAIKRADQLRDIPVILLSASEDPEDIIRGLNDVSILAVEVAG